MNIIFSNGDIRTIDLGSTSDTWYYFEFEPAINTTSLKLSAQQYYTPEHLDDWFYRIKEISISTCLLYTSDAADE